VRILKRFNDRWCVFSPEKWFQELRDLWIHGYERDDDYACDCVERALFLAAEEHNVPIPPGTCGYCDRRHSTVVYEGRECARCVVRHENNQAAELERKQEHERWLNSLSVEQRQHYEKEQAIMFRGFMDGLISRDVQ